MLNPSGEIRILPVRLRDRVRSVWKLARSWSLAAVSGIVATPVDSVKSVRGGWLAK